MWWRAVNFAREQGLDLSVRGGAHNVAGLATNDGGIVIDLSEMRAVFVDPANQTAYAQGGALGAISTGKRRCSGWPRRGASSPPPASVV